MLRTLLEAGEVQRFHAHPHVQPKQTLASHGYGVAAIVHCVWPDCHKDLIIAALFHDAVELKTGDIPAPVKWDFPELERVLRTVEDKIFQANPGLAVQKGLTELQEKVLKFADMLDFVHYCSQLQSRGNFAVSDLIRIGIDVCEQRIARLEEYGGPIPGRCRQALQEFKDWDISHE